MFLFVPLVFQVAPPDTSMVLKKCNGQKREKTHLLFNYFFQQITQPLILVAVRLKMFGQSDVRQSG